MKYRSHYQWESAQGSMNSGKAYKSMQVIDRMCSDSGWGSNQFLRANYITALYKFAQALPREGPCVYAHALTYTQSYTMPWLFIIYLSTAYAKYIK